MANDSPNPKEQDPGNVSTPVVVSLTKKSSPIKPKFDEKEVKAMSSKKYMDTLVVPTLLKALTATNKQRPTDPVEFLGNYLLRCSNESAAQSADTDSSAKEEPTTKPKEEKME